MRRRSWPSRAPSPEVAISLNSARLTLIRCAARNGRAYRLICGEVDGASRGEQGYRLRAGHHPQQVTARTGVTRARGQVGPIRLEASCRPTTHICCREGEELRNRRWNGSSRATTAERIEMASTPSPRRLPSLPAAQGGLRAGYASPAAYRCGARFEAQTDPIRGYSTTLLAK
jgi:hypothetical protein